MPAIPDREAALRDKWREQVGLPPDRKAALREKFETQKSAAIASMEALEAGREFCRLAKSVIRPCCIGAAFQNSFEFHSRVQERAGVIAALWEELPLTECGWCPANSILDHVTGNRWRLTRRETV